MKVRILEDGMSSAVWGAPAKGAEIEMDDADANCLIRAGRAEAITKPEVRETADRKPPARRAK